MYDMELKTVYTQIYRWSLMYLVWKYPDLLANSRDTGTWSD